MMNRQQPVRKFTGWHMTAILVGFFGIVIAVNFTMARFALGSFGGTVVDNSYVASQNFNNMLEKAERQDRLGWTVTGRLDNMRHVEIVAAMDGDMLAGMKISANASHPLGRKDGFALSFAEIRPGVYRSSQIVPDGRWYVDADAELGGNGAKYRFELK